MLANTEPMITTCVVLYLTSAVNANGDIICLQDTLWSEHRELLSRPL